jgi:hypothetical protein
MQHNCPKRINRIVRYCIDVITIDVQ